MICAAALLAAMLAGCTNAADAEAAQERPAEGRPYELAGTQVWTVPDPASGRSYQVFVSLPAGYEANAARRYPVMYVADADYGFPLIRSIARRVNLEGPAVEDFILVGLSYAVGEDGANSRRRDYTPTANGPRSAGNALHGAGAAYQNYIKTQVLPFVEQRFRAGADIAGGRGIEGGAIFEEDLPRARFGQPVGGLEHLAYRVAGGDDAGFQQDHMGKIARWDRRFEPDRTAGRNAPGHQHRRQFGATGQIVGNGAEQQGRRRRGHALRLIFACPTSMVRRLVISYTQPARLRRRLRPCKDGDWM